MARALLATSLLCLALPAVATAHGLDGEYDPTRPVGAYVWLGIRHMIGGWDHLLFIAGVVLLSGSARSAAKLVTAFVAGHSLTLLIATLAGWRISPTAVDVVIALSLVYVGAQGLRGRPRDLRMFAAVVFAFGLVHGLGLSTRLQDLGLPEDGLIARVLLFNVGLEIGQLAALAAIVGVGWLIARGLSGRDVRRPAFGLLTVAGLVAAVVLSFPAAADRDSEDEQTAAAQPTGACVERETAPPQFIGGGHPEKSFFEPSETAPQEDLVHVVGDGYVIVRYRPDLPAAEVEQLRAFVAEPASETVVGAPDPSQEEAVVVQVAYKTLTCDTLDVARLQSFRDEWLAFVQQQTG